MSPAGGPNLDFDAWFNAIDQRRLELDPILTKPGVVALVRSRTKAGLGHVPDLSIHCGDHDTGYSVRLSVEDSAVKVAYVTTPELTGTTPAGMTHVDEAVPPLSFRCPVCSKRVNRRPLWVVKESLRALVSISKRHPYLQVAT